MKVDIQFCDVELGEAIETHIQRKLHIALSRMVSYITTISISISDVNELEACGDKYCRVQISSTEFDDIIIEDTQIDLFYVIDRVIQRASRSLELKIAQL